MPIRIDSNGRKIMSQEDYDAWKSSLENNWNKEAHIAAINSLHDELFASILAQHKYIDMSELTMWAMLPDSQYRTEANAIKYWYKTTYMLIEQYAETVTELTALTPEAFIDTLPVFSFP